jgi:hypothetical protein
MVFMALDSSYHGGHFVTKHMHAWDQSALGISCLKTTLDLTKKKPTKKKKKKKTKKKKTGTALSRPRQSFTVCGTLRHSFLFQRQSYQFRLDLQPIFNPFSTHFDPFSTHFRPIFNPFSTHSQPIFDSSPTHFRPIFLIKSRNQARASRSAARTRSATTMSGTTTLAARASSWLRCSAGEKTEKTVIL